MQDVTTRDKSPSLERRQSNSASPRLYTADELLRLSSKGDQRYALMRGDLITMAPAGAEHGDRALNLGARMRIFADDHDLGTVFAAETGFQLEYNPDTVLAPDAAFVRKERLPVGKLPTGYFPGAPDLAVEVVSPGDTRRKVNDKVAAWLHFGTRLVWVLRSHNKSVTIHRADGTEQVLNEGDMLDGEDLLPGFQVPVSHLFR
jgi:Uma2 family endonuclease